MKLIQEHAFLMQLWHSLSDLKVISGFLFSHRSGASEFIVPYWRLLKSLNHPFSIGMRFRVCYESEDANERSALLSQPNGISLSQIS